MSEFADTYEKARAALTSSCDQVIADCKASFLRYRELAPASRQIIWTLCNNPETNAIGMLAMVGWATVMLTIDASEAASSTSP